MGRPIFLVENAFNLLQFPLHALAANEEASGHEAFRIANGRRSSLDYWTPTTLNVSANVKVTCDVSRTCDTFILDRGHNLGGKEVILERSDNDFSSSTTVFDITLPSASAPGDIDDANGVVNEEGAWLKRFSPAGALGWRIRVPAMGASLKPQIVGAWLGQAYSPADIFRPLSVDGGTLYTQESASAMAWMGRGPRNFRREGDITLQFPDLTEYATARYHLHQRFHKEGRPMWIVFDDTKADVSLLALGPAGARWGFTREPQWFAERVSMPYLEHEPLPVT